MKRIYTFDLVRGIAIIGIPLIHRIVWDYYFQNTDSIDGSSNVGFFLLLLIMSMAGIFYCISGVVNSYMSFNYLKEGKMTVKQYSLKSFVAGLSFILIGLFFRYFLLRSIDDVVSIKILYPGEIQTDNVTGVIPYLILYGKYPLNFDYTVLFSMGTLQMIGYSIISVSIVISIYFKRNGLDNPQRLRKIFLILGIVIFLSYAIIQPFLSPIAQQKTENGMYYISFFLNPFTEGLFPLIPHLAFGFFGAFFGIELARDDFDTKKFVKSMRIFWVVTLIGGIVFLMVLVVTVGVDLIALEEWYYKMARKLLQLGLYFALFLLGLEIFDFQPEEKRNRRIKWTKPIADMGRMTMTIYLLEGIVAVSLQRIFSPFWVNWNSTLGNILVFGLINVAVWIAIVSIWKQFKYKGTIEHLSVVLVKAITGQSSQKMQIHTKEKDS